MTDVYFQRHPAGTFTLGPVVTSLAAGQVGVVVPAPTAPASTGPAFILVHVSPGAIIDLPDGAKLGPEPAHVRTP